MKINLISGAVITAYLIFCSSLYLWVFWLHFDINILQFIDSSDIIKSASLPAIPVVIFLGVSIAIQQFNIIQSDQHEELRKNGRGSKTLSYITKAYIAFLLIITVVSLGEAAYQIFTAVLPIKYMKTAYLLGTATSFLLLFKVKLFKDWGEFRLVIIPLICYLPTHIMNRAIDDANNIISGKDTFIISSNLSCSNDKKDKYRYIATLSDKVFSISLKDDSLCIQKYEFLSLSREKDAKPLTKLTVK